MFKALSNWWFRRTHRSEIRQLRELSILPIRRDMEPALKLTEAGRSVGLTSALHGLNLLDG